MIGEYNIGSLYYAQLYLEDMKHLHMPPDFWLIRARIYDCLDTHPSNGGLNVHNRTNHSPEAIDDMQMRAITRLHAKKVSFDQLITNYFYYPKDIDKRLTRRLDILNDQDIQGVTVSRVDMAEYIRAKYPNLLIRWSVTAVYRDAPKDIVSYTRKVLKIADRIVLPPEYNDQLQQLKRLPASQIELMAADRCGVGCPFRKQHYTLSSREQIAMEEGKLDPSGNGPGWNLSNKFCMYSYSKTNNLVNTRAWVFIDRAHLAKLLEIGIVSYKIASRNFIDQPDILHWIVQSVDLLSTTGAYTIPANQIPKEELQEVRRLSKTLKKEIE